MKIEIANDIKPERPADIELYTSLATVTEANAFTYIINP